MDLLHAAPFQGIMPRPYLKGTYIAAEESWSDISDRGRGPLVILLLPNE